MEDHSEIDERFQMKVDRFIANDERSKDLGCGRWGFNPADQAVETMTENASITTYGLQYWWHIFYIPAVTYERGSRTKLVDTDMIKWFRDNLTGPFQVISTPENKHNCFVAIYDDDDADLFRVAFVNGVSVVDTKTMRPEVRAYAVAKWNMS